MNRIPITLLTGAIRERDELKRRMAKILDKPISLGTHYSADETPEGRHIPETVKPLVNERHSDSWVGKCTIILALTTAVMGAIAFLFA